MLSFASAAGENSKQFECGATLSPRSDFCVRLTYDDYILTCHQKLENDGTLDEISSAIHTGLTEYAVSELGIPGLRHFVYKSRSHVQITMPIFEDPYDNPHEKRRIITMYQVMHDAIHAKSGQDSPLKLQYILTECESVMGWASTWKSCPRSLLMLV